VKVDGTSDTHITMLGILDELFAALARRGVRCCHWKSNSHLAAAARGETDLDLLVDRARADAFRQVAADLGFKSVRAAPGKHYPGVENHLGYDGGTGRLVHLHVHYDLVLGQQHVKDHRLPIEEHVLASVTQLDGVPVPAPELELIILALRAVLKYRLRDAFKDAFGIGPSGIPGPIRDEAAWLLGRTSPHAVRTTLAELPPIVPAGWVMEIIGRLTSPRTRGLWLLVLRERVRVALRPMRRVSRTGATARYLLALWRKRARRTGIATKRRMTLHDGGTTIGIVGSDGAGKTTLIAALDEWLAWRLDVRTLYMGIPPEPSGLRWFLKRVTRLARAAERRIDGTGGRDVVRRALREVGDVSLGLRRVDEARRRLARHRQGLRHAARGAVVLFDRYPLPAASVQGRSMDGARLKQEIAPPWSPPVAWLMRRERGLYDRVTPPRHLLALNVTPEQSLRRKPDHDPVGIAAKTAAIRTLASDDTGLVVVDADQPADRVLAEVKARIWTWL